MYISPKNSLLTHRNYQFCFTNTISSGWPKLTGLEEGTNAGGAHGGLDWEQTSEQCRCRPKMAGDRFWLSLHHFPILYFIFWLSLVHIHFHILYFVFHNITYTFLFGIWYFGCHYTTFLFGIWYFGCHYITYSSLFHYLQIHSFVFHATHINFCMWLHDIAYNLNYFGFHYNTYTLSYCYTYPLLLKHMQVLYFHM